MKVYIITGTSKGLGKSLALALLQNPQTIVYGYSRTQTIYEERYIHQTIDLSKEDAYLHVNFPDLQSITSLVLINNAATIIPIGFVGALDSQALSQALILNFHTPIMLMNRFMNTYRNINGRKQIVNIGTGASTNPYAGWSVYCSAKAGLEMFTKVGSLEQKSEELPFEFYQIAPGVLDTEMQANIRETPEEMFPMKSKFLSLFENGHLKSADSAAKALIEHIDKPYSENDFIYRLNA